MSRTRSMIGSVAGFVAWWPAMIVGLRIAHRRELGSGAEFAEWAERFASGVAVAVENQIKLWEWPSGTEPSSARPAPDPPVVQAENDYFNRIAGDLGKSYTGRTR